MKRRYKKTFSVYRKHAVIIILVMGIGVYTLDKIHLTVYIRWVYFISYKLCPNITCLQEAS